MTTVTLADALALIETLASSARMGRNWRKAALGLADTDLDKLTGLVINGTAFRITKVVDYAPCGCRDGRHTFSRDGSAWFARGHFTTHDEADRKAARTQGHVVKRVVAYTDLEVVDS